MLTIAVGGLCARLLLQGHGTGGGHEHHGHHAMPWGRIWGLTGGVAAVVGMAGWFAVGPYIHRQQVGVASQHIHPVTITLTARDLQFEPAVVEVPVGRPVRLKLVNEGQQDHDLNIPDLPYRRSDRADLRAEPLGFHLFAGPGEDAALEFIALREGEYKAYCSVPGHREAGMQVLLRVTDAK